MRTSIFILLLLSCCTLVKAQENFWKPYKNDREKLEVNSNALKFEQSHYNCSKSGGSLKLYKRSEMRAYNRSVTFDSSGNVIAETSFNSDGTTYRWTTFQYENSVLLKKRITYDSIEFYTTVYSYNERNELTTETELSPTGDTTRVVNNRYDAEGRLVELMSEDLKGSSLDFKKTYEYFPTKNCIVEKVYDGKDKLRTTREFVYNSSFDLVKFTNSYDGKSSITEYEYNEFGNISKVTQYPQSGSKGFETVLTYEYVYDTNGNWIQKTEFSDWSDDCQTYIRIIQ